MKDANQATKIDFSKVKRIGFLGYGRSSSGALEYIRKKYPHITFTLRDEKERDSFPEFFSSCYSGKDAFLDIKEEILFLSPSVNRSRPELSDALRHGVRLCSDLDLFFAEYRGLSFGVTGSDGKSTTTYLISELLKCADIDATPCGNFGLSPCALLDCKSIPVLELSSFQLSYISPKLSFAVITNITPNHLDWHKDFLEYKRAKLSILKNAQSVVFDFDDPEVASGIGNKQVLSVISLKLDYAEICKELLAEHYITLKNGYIMINGAAYLRISELKRREEHNLRNIMLALGAALPFISRDTAKKTLINFKGLAHRAETVCEADGIRYINSSIDTTPSRCSRTLCEAKNETVVILGGRGKGLPLGELPEAIINHTRGAVLLGSFGDEVFEALFCDERFSHFPLLRAKDMRDAIIKARGLLTCGGDIILSPGATSYDVYNNFEERGLDFKRIAIALSDNK